MPLWDSQWYGGHWTLNYSVIFAPIGWLAGIPLMEIVCVAVAAWAFDRLAVARFGRSGRVAAIVFAAGTIVQVSIGQEPYLLGETIAAIRPEGPKPATASRSNAHAATATHTISISGIPVSHPIGAKITE